MARWPSRNAAARASLTRNHRVIRRHNGRGGSDGHLELPGAVFRQERIGREARRPQRGDKAGAERSLPAERVQAIGVAGAVLIAGIDELLLERRDQAPAAGILERADGTPQELARAALPGRAIGIADIAEEEMFRCGAVGEVDTHLRRRIGHDHQVAGGSEGRIEHGAECGLHQVGVCPAHAPGAARVDGLRGKSFAANMARDVADADKNQFLAQHPVAPLQYPAACAATA